MDNFSKRLLQAVFVGAAMVPHNTYELIGAEEKKVVSIKIEEVRRMVEESMASCNRQRGDKKRDLLLVAMFNFINEEGGEERFYNVSEADLQAIVYEERMAQYLINKMEACVDNVNFVPESGGRAIMVKFMGNEDYEKLGILTWTMENNDGNYSLHGVFEGIDSKSRVFKKNIEIRQLEPEPIDDYGQFYNA